LKLKILPHSSRISPGSLIYRAEEYSFDFEPAPRDVFSSVSINNLNLGVDHDGRLISVWGMCPHTVWTNTSLTAPVAGRGDVLIVSEFPLIRGVSVRVDENEPWPAYVDITSGWIQVANGRPAAKAVAALPGVIVEATRDDDFSALWLKPLSLPESIL
jgi:hypothetical protein